MIAFHVLILILGLAILIAGAESMVRGASSLAKRFGISPLVIGLTIVAFGTSMPELVVNLFSAFRGSADLAIGNIIGSNISNILLILGVSATIVPLAVHRNTTWKEIPFALLAVVLVFLMGNDVLLDGAVRDILSRTDGILLISMFIIFMYYTVSIAKVDTGSEQGSVRLYSVNMSTVLVISGLVALFLGGKLLVDEAVVFARLAGMSEALIGLTIVAIGTSLPELATSVIAALHKQNDIAVGNIVGSNIFNVFWILGLTSTILPLPFNSAISVDVLVSILATFILFIAMFIGKRHTLQRWQGVSLLLLYAGYMVYIITRG
ncbi:MAG: calcium/sodium antiporter [Patescibacteria group bacterium]